MSVQYLDEDNILLLHSIVIDETGGSHGVRDMHAILSLVALPQQKISGEELYPTIFKKAAVYARNIIQNHPFVDGNKRTGMLSAGVFLEDNGYTVTAKEGEVEEMGLRIATQKLDIQDIAEWLKTHTKKL